MTNTRANALISAAILARVQKGMSMKDAMDEVLGAGTYEKLAGDVYDQLRAKQGLAPAPSSSSNT